MNIAAYLQDRQLGLVSHRSRKFRFKQLDQFLDEKTAESLVNKPCSVSGSSRSTFIMEFSPDGTKIASAHGDHTVRVTDIATGQCVRTLQGHPRTPWCLAYHPSSSHILASGCLGGQVRIWDLYGYGCEVWQTENSNVIASLTFHPTDHVLVIAAGNSIYFWDWGKPQPFAKCSTLHEYERIRWLQFDSLGHHLYTGISNNTSIHRDEVASVSLSSQSQNAGPRQPSRLNSVYSRIINCYQDYRRDRLAQETTVSGDDPESSNQASTEEDMYPGVRDIDIVEPRSPPRISAQRVNNPTSVSSRRNLSTNISDQIIQLSSNAAQNAGRPAVRNATDCLINPRNDPFLSPGPSQSIFVNPSPSDLIPTDSNNPPLSNISLNSRTDRSFTRRQGAFSLHAVQGAAGRLPNSSTSQMSGVIRPGIATSSTSSTTSTVAPTTSSSKLPDSVQALSESIRTSITSCSDVNPYLARYLKKQISKKSSASSTATQPGKPFASIRDRLKTSIPLSTKPSDTVSSPGHNARGIPPVTIIPASDSAQPVTVQSNSGSNNSQVSVVFSRQPERLSTMLGNIPVSTASVNNQQSKESMSDSSDSIYNTSVFKRLNQSKTEVIKNSQESFNETDTNTPDDSVDTLPGPPTDRCSYGAGSVPWTDSAFSSSSDFFPRSRSHVSAGRPSTTPNRTSQANSFKSFLRHKIEWERRNARRPKPYHRPERPRDMSILGPYLDSRGIPNPPSATSNHDAAIDSVIDRVLWGDSRALREGEIALREGELALRAGERVIREGERVLRVGDQALRDRESSGNQEEVQISAKEDAETVQQRLVTDDNVTQGSLQNESTASDNQNRGGYCFLPISNLSSTNTPSQPSHTVSNSNSMIGGESVTPVQSPGPVSQTSDSGAISQPMELVVDQNENYIAVRNANTIQMTNVLNEVQVSTNDDNNNTLHFVQQNNPVVSSTSTAVNPRNNTERDYLSLRNTFVSMTDQIEREMSDLNRRINALRDSFNQNLFTLRQDRQRYENVGESMNLTAGSSEIENSELHPNLETRNVPEIITSMADQETAENEQMSNIEVSDTHGFMIQPPTLLETSLRSHRRRQNQLSQRPPPYYETTSEPQDWRQLQRHYLHPHYSSSIFDETINRPSNVIQSAINRAIAGAFMGTGESAVANNIINQTHRIQYWDFTKCDIPDISNSNKNIIVPHCKLHNSASCDIAKSGSLLATFVPSHHGFPDDNILAVYSILPENRGQCLYTKSFGPNAISISISPSSNYILVGLAAKKLSWVFTARQIVAQIYKLDQKEAGEKSTKLVKDIFHTCNSDVRTHVSGNSARWLPVLGQGLVYGTNRGHLNICKPGVKTPVRKVGVDTQNLELAEDDQSESVRRFILRRVPWLTHTDPHRVSASTQTQGTRHTAATQTNIE